MFTTIPASYSGKIKKLYHKEEEICQTFAPLYDIEIEGGEADTEEKAPEKSEEKAPEKSEEHSKKIEESVKEVKQEPTKQGAKEI